MKAFRYFSPFVVLIALCASALAQNVQTDYDKKADFSQYKTYYWNKMQTSNPLWQQHITDAVDKNLQSKGWQKIQSGGDVAVTAVAATQSQQEYKTFYNDLAGYGWGKSEIMSTTTTTQGYQTGTLVVDMFDVKTKRSIWRGTASDAVSKKPSKNEKNLDQAVDKMFNNFPLEAKD